SHYPPLLTTVLVAYEYSLTISVEYRVIWCRKFTIPSILYLINRYTLFVLVVLVWLADYPFRCTIVGDLLMTLALTMRIARTGFLVLRMHVINNHRWFWTVLLAGLALATIPIDLVRSKNCTLAVGRI
ncbi:hypothetical protein C8Q74DRAFT_1211759, partial [Fomes fomentarius]